MELLKSKLLSAPHGFPTRQGGLSQGPFASLNASATVGDEPAHVEANLERLAAAAQVAPDRIRLLSQVHGDLVIEATEVAPQAPPTADGQWTQAPGVAIGVRTADCLPILLEDPIGRRVAAVHAGWRGVIAKIVVKAIDALVAQGTRPENLRAAIGPAIGPCCFEVDGDVPDRFAAAFGAAVVRRVEGRAKPFLDLAACVRQSLEQSGVPRGQVDALGACTSCDARFYSHRRDQGRTGRHLSFITCRFETHL